MISLVGAHSPNHNMPEALATLRTCVDNIGAIVYPCSGLEGVADIMKNGAPKGSIKVQWVKQNGSLS